MSYERKRIVVYHTHIEVYPYEDGECEKVERDMSVYDKARHKFMPIGFYVHNDTLYLARGYPIHLLEKIFRTDAIISHEADEYDTFNYLHMTVPPKSRIQEEGIEFLSGVGRFSNALTCSQQALTLDTGDGKTYAAVHAIMNLKMTAVVITFLDKIRQQWKDTFLSKTNINEKDIVVVNGSDDVKKVIKGKLVGQVYLVLHQTLTSFGTNNGWDEVREFFKATRAGIKVIDEAHLYFNNTILIDMFSNVKKTYYLTANFERSSFMESIIFKRCFSSVYKFGEETKNYEEKRKHIIFIPVLYGSNPTQYNLIECVNYYGFSSINFSEYALHNDPKKTQLTTLFMVLDKVINMEGRILITVPRIEDSEYIKDEINDKYGDYNKKLATIHSKHSKEENEKATKSDIIVSTIKSCGTGVDIPKLRCLINLEPFSSVVTSNQLSGRLREYAPDKDTYFFDLIDMDFPNCRHQYEVKLRNLRKKCKEIRTWNIN